MRFSLSRKVALAFLLLSYPSLYHKGAEVEKYSLPEALKVLKAIEIMEESMGDHFSSLREITISESELNSYIAYRIETEKEDLMKELRLKLLDKNKLEGKVLIDLTGQAVPAFIRPRMNFYLSADLLVENGRARLVIRELFLEGQPIQPMLLDFVIGLIARIKNTEASGLQDWYDLPVGIKDIRISKGKAVFYY